MRLGDGGMYLRTAPITKVSKEIEEVKDLLFHSFPPNEQIPIQFLLWRAKKDFIDFIAFYDQDVFVGFTYLITDEDLTFILYLAIKDDMRSKGYGKMIVSKIKDMYPNNRIILNIEAIDEAADNYEQRVMRKAFYLRNGFQQTNLLLKDSGFLYEVLINQSFVTKDEYLHLLKRFPGTFLFSLVKSRIVLLTN